MKIDHDYLKKLLEAYQAAEGPTTDLKELQRNGIDLEDKKFEFHVVLLLDKGLIEGSGKSGGAGSVGLQRFVNGNMTVSLGVQSRLTATGHEFIEALEQPDIWQTITTGFKNTSLETMLSVSRDLLSAILKKKLLQLTGE